MPLLSMVSASLLLAMAALPVAAQPLGALQWKSRIVLVFGSDGAAVEGQIGAFAKNRDAVRDRDMLILRVEGETVSSALGEAPELPRAGELREQYGIAADAPLAVILVGKDGGEKLRRVEPVAPADIFALIDSMPMRQSETRG